jgi:hypothetical protein
MEEEHPLELEEIKRNEMKFTEIDEDQPSNKS